ncbi:hypothetical protein LAZ67_2005337 [Cordylochernes scorpioides]|uniref:Integrase catalytic domain-containing protein n=1 Tax=Cordylochernes scorpioides TaxID=51811 RepID=A0ABY6K7J6_9ARAC|nr:hypothetical protein LAZ67_2005337 [Cordylochernes scorpioides]
MYELLDICNESLRNLETIGLERNEMVDVMLIHFLQKKLDTPIRQQWELSYDNQEMPSYQRALLDNGSQRSLITEKCAAKLGIPIRRKRIAVGGLGDQLVESSLGEILIRFSSHFDHQSFETTALVLTKLTNNIPRFTVKKINYSHMKGLILTDPSYFNTREIDVILGSDIVFNLIQEGRRNGNENEPSAIHSKLGWLVYGSTSVSERQSFRNMAHFSSELESEDLIKRFWELESIHLEEIPTKEEKDCESHYLKNVVRDESGRYIVRLPFKESAEKLGQSKSIAIRRFLNLEKGLEQTESIYVQYKQFMNEYIRLGHMKASCSLQTEPKYYIPHHCILKAQPTKLRVVFDASTKTTTQISLNDLLHVGPKLQNNIFSILLKFRTNSVALVADIEKMYRQTRLHPDDIKYQTILWRDCKDLELQEYNLLTVTYGLACAPYLAIRTLHQIAHEVQVSNPRVSKIIREDFYVDDLLTGCPTVEDAKGLVQQLIAVLGSGGFVLRKWVSNETSIIEVSPLLLRGKGEVMEFNRKESGVNVLGIQWDPSYDTLNISCKSGPADIKSKRQIVSAIARIYDPCGWVSPTTVVLKLLLQEIWKLKCGWDEDIPASIQRNKNKSCASIKKITIPRLELCAALMLAQLQSQTTQAPSFNIDEQFYWTDSKIVLAWIISESKKWQIFVANRVAKIQDLTAAYSWLYISGKQNPADLATRGILPSYSQGILRVGGRLRHSDLDIDQKHPMLIPKDHFVTKLIVLHYHLNNLHSGTQLTLSLIRNKFWIPSGRNLIKRVLNQCLVCLKSKSKAIHQIMGDLPKNRLLPGRPFEKIGIDLAGPIQAKPMLKRSKVIFKFYIVLFVCFTTKAIHLVISSDLTAETFLAALKRFISRRGRPTDIYSDNATNFKGASNILKERWKLFNAANIQDFSAIESINWHFIPPSTPNFGGLWEAGIKSVKTILSKTMKSRLLNYEELLTLLAQIEACLNSRPLTFVSNDPNDLTALTPGHFLIGNAIRHDAESDHSALNLRSRWDLIQPQRDYFWNRWSCEYLHQLQERRKWRTSHPDVNIGDLVMLKEQNKPLQWKLARIVQIFPGEDDHVRVVLLRTPKGLLKRPITKICPLPYKDQPFTNGSLTSKHGQEARKSYRLACLNVRGIAARHRSIELCCFLGQHAVYVAFIQETNVTTLDSVEDLCLGYRAEVVPASGARGSGLACIFSSDVQVIGQRVLSPGKIAAFDVTIRGIKATFINCHLSNSPEERLDQLQTIAAAAANEDAWVHAAHLASAIKSLHDLGNNDDDYISRARKYIQIKLEDVSINSDYPSLPDLGRALRLRFRGTSSTTFYDSAGRVITGPAVRDLAFANLKERFSHPTCSPEDIDGFLRGFTLRVTIEESDPLHRYGIGEEEIVTAIGRLPTGKEAGWDDLSCELFRGFEDFFASALRRVFEASQLCGALPSSMRRSEMSLIAKPHGVLGLAGLRPLFLQTTDYRVLSGVLYWRLRPHLRDIVPECQSYAVPGRTPAWNISRVADEVTTACREETPLAVVATDLESAFDTLDRGFLMSVLLSVGLPPVFVGEKINILGTIVTPGVGTLAQDQHLQKLLERAIAKWSLFVCGLSLAGRAKAANSLVLSAIYYHLQAYLPSETTIARLLERLARFVWGSILERPISVGGMGLLDVGTQLRLSCLKGVQSALRGGRNAHSWLAESGTWLSPASTPGTWLPPRRRRSLHLFEASAKILELNHRILQPALLQALRVVGDCRLLRPPELLAPTRWLGWRIGELTGPPSNITLATRGALADAAALGSFCSRLITQNARGRHRVASLMDAIVVRGTTTAFQRLTTRTARRMLEPPRLAALPITQLLGRWLPHVGIPISISLSSLRRCAFSGHNADVAVRLALHALPHPAHPASARESCIAWHDLEDDALAIMASAKTRIYKHFLGLEMRGVQEDPLLVWRRTLSRWWSLPSS